MMTDDLLSPDDLFRYYQRGMLDQHTLHTQILLRLIELTEMQQAHGVLLGLATEEVDGLDLDVAAIARYLHMTRPSQVKRDEAGFGGQNGSTGPGSAERDDDVPDQPPEA
jgi:hypothetical protein